MAAEILPNRSDDDPRRPRRTPRPDFSQRRPSPLMVSLLGIKGTERYQREPTYLPESFPPHNLQLAYLMAYLNYCDDVPLRFERIVSNIYEIHPQLVAKEYGEKEWLFFTMRGRKYMNETVINIASLDGAYWKLLTGFDEPIGGPLGRNYGVCKTFCFCKGKVQFEPDDPSNWFLEEYRLSKDYYETTKSGFRAFDDWVVCKLIHISPGVRNELNPVVNFKRRRFSINPLTLNIHPLVMADIIPLTVNYLLTGDHPVVCIPDLFKYFAKAPTPSTSLNDVKVEFNLGASTVHPLIDPTRPPMVYVILLCAISNCGDQILKGSFPVIDHMIITNIYELNPDELADDHGGSEDKEWFCFTIRSRDRANAMIVNHAGGDGYWHLDVAYGRAIITTEDGALSIGVRRTFEFYKGKYPGDKTSWTMHEFRLNESFLRTWKVVGDWVLCKIWNKDKTPQCKLLNSITTRIGTTL